MQEIQRKPRMVRELLSGAKYHIDYYQREHKWQNKQMVELASDLTGAFLRNYRETHQRSDVGNYGHYFLGSIVISQRTDEQQISEHLIVDDHYTAPITSTNPASCNWWHEQVYLSNPLTKSRKQDLTNAIPPTNVSLNNCGH